MEGQNERVEQEIQEPVRGLAQEVDIPMVAEAVSREIPEAPEQPIGEPEEEQPTEEEYDEEYPEDYVGDEEYPEDEYEGDDDWEGEVGGSEQAPLGGLYGLFNKVLRKPDTTRVSNLTNEELGVLPISVRGAQWIALIARTFRHKGVANFFDQQANLITTSAMARKGWFSELFITSKKFASRESGSSISNLPQFSKKSKWRVFSDRESQPVQEPI